MRRGRGEIKKLSDLFEKYRTQLRAPEASVIKEFCEVVYDLSGITIPQSKVRYRPGTKILSLTVGGPLKQEVVLRKSEILTHLKGRLGAKSAPQDII